MLARTRGSARRQAARSKRLLAAALALGVLVVACVPRPLRTAVPMAAPKAAQVMAAAPLPMLDGLLDGIVPDTNLDNYAIVMEDLHSGARGAMNEGQVFPSASLYKLGVAWLALRRVDSGALSLDQPLPIEPQDSVEPEPDGGVAADDTPTVRAALGVMLSLSSNTAAHALLRILGRSEFNQEMDRIGLSQTRVPEDSQELDPAAVAVTSAADIAHLLRLMATPQMLSDSARAELFGWLADTAPPDALRDTLPASVDVLDKTGNLDDASNVGALLQSTSGAVILVVIDHGVDPGDARGVIAQLGQVAYDALLQ